MLQTDHQQLDRWRERREQIVQMSVDDAVQQLAARANAARRTIIETISTAGQGHLGGDLSVTDILTVLFEHTMKINPSQPPTIADDRFVLSKGHCAAALYTTLANVGYFPPSQLVTFMAPMSDLNGHPNRNKVPGVETNTGPLGHGLPFAVGLAIAARLAGSNGRVFVVVGDGEMQEGSNWEALMAAAHHGLGNLTAIIDRNRLQQGDCTESTNGLEPLADKLTAFGLEVRDVDGHDYAELIDAFKPSFGGKPVGVIARTTKGRGVSFIEDRAEWHHKVPTAEQVTAALQELQS